MLDLVVERHIFPDILKLEFRYSTDIDLLIFPKYVFRKMLKKVILSFKEGDYPRAVELLFTCKNSELADLRESYRKGKV